MSALSQPELLAPAGNLEKLSTALHYGADAIYIGLPQFSLRAQTGSLDESDIERAVAEVRRAGRRIYVTANIYLHNEDLAALRDHATFLARLAPDGVIVSDPGSFEIFARLAPEVPIHISTQANTTNAESARFWQRLGARRIVLARELTLNEVCEIRAAVDLELEAFVHGAICIAYSGRCFISSFLSNRSANSGECANSCRWNYTLMEEKRPGEHFPVFEDDRGTYIMSSRDLCMLEHVAEMRRAGIDSFKLEGRMKGINYLAGVVRVYRQALDRLELDGEQLQLWLGQWRRELEMFSNRGFTTGKYLGDHPDSDYNHDEPVYRRSGFDFLGKVAAIESSWLQISLRNNLRPGDRLLLLAARRNGAQQPCEDLSFTVTKVLHGSREVAREVEVARNGDQVWVEVGESVTAACMVGDLFRLWPQEAVVEVDGVGG